MKGGRFVAALGVHQHAPRGWTPEEVALVEETAERTWAALERARAEEALRESEEKYHMLFTSIDEAFALCKIVVDDNGEPTDYLLLDVNPAFEEMIGITPEAAEGKTARELVPGIEEWWIETYGKVALGGETIRFENRVGEMDRWFDAYAAPVGEGDEGLFALVFKDITGRRREEEERGRMRSREAAERERISRELHDRVHTRWASPTRASSSKGPWPKAPPSAPGRRSQSPRRPRKAP